MDGGLANKGFRFFDHRLAEGITMSGQLIIQHAEKQGNDFLNKILKTKKDYCIAADTDSCYLNLEDFVAKFYPDRSIDDTVDFLDKSCVKIQDVLNKACDDLSTSLNWNVGKINFKREAIASTGFWTGKKMYALLVHDNEGVRYAEPELKVMGLSLVRSSTPAVVKQPLRDCIIYILTKTEKDLQDFVAGFEDEYNNFPVEKIAFPRSANNLQKYSDQSTIYGFKCPIGTKSALLYNYLIDKNNLQDRIEKVSEGGKIRFVYLKEPNMLRESVIGFVGKLPIEFKLHPHVDYKVMFQKSFLDPLEKITKVVSWNYQKIGTLDDLFE